MERRGRRPAVPERANTADAAAEGYILDDEGGTINLTSSTCESEVICVGGQVEAGCNRKCEAAVPVLMLDEEQPERNGSKGR